MADLRTAFIAEEVEFDDRGPVAIGLFWGSVQTDAGGILDAIDRDLSLAEAVRWGRTRADRVVVRVAGEEPYIDAGHGERRELARRRPAGWEFLDRTSADPPILWDVIVEKAAAIPAGPVRPDGTWTGFATVPHAIVQVEAAGYEDALAAAVAGAPPDLTATRAFPTGSRAAQANARLDANGTLFSRGTTGV
jgi:hypothetical protein